MKKIISTEKIPIKMWLDYLEDGAEEQAKNLANLPFAFKHIAIMPDSHQGYGMPIGGVMATKNVIVPNAVGVDIGCGMCAVKTSLTDIDRDILKKIIGEIRKVIPVGFNKHSSRQESMPKKPKKVPIVSKEFSNAEHSLGTLGGGNHFIEIQKGSDGYIYIMIHSGSRNLGLKVAHYYNKLAEEVNEKWKGSVPKNQGLAYLLTDSKEGQAYLREMQYCVDFALASRKLMFSRCMQVIYKIIPELHLSELNEFINIAHNYAKLENHFGENVWVHRKGATLADENTV